LLDRLRLIASRFDIGDDLEVGHPEVPVQQRRPSRKRTL
jgi:hypothetical protein